jgi:hypothetical protein
LYEASRQEVASMLTMFNFMEFTKMFSFVLAYSFVISLMIFFLCSPAANQDPLDEDQMPPLADDDSDDEDDEWNWTQIPIQPAKKVERPATRFGGKPKVSYQHSIPNGRFIIPNSFTFII